MNSNLQSIRKAAGMSQAALSKKTGLSTIMISHYESGYRNINKCQAMTLYKIASALGCEMEQLLQFEADSKSKINRDG